MPGPYAFKQIFAADPSNTSNVAKGGSVLLFAPGDASRKPLVLTDLANGMVLPNPVPINSNGFGPAFLHETLPQVAWEGGGFSGTFESFEGLRADAVAAVAASQASAQAAGDARVAAEAAAGNAATGAAGALAGAVAEATAAKVAAQQAAGLVGAPAGAAVLAAIQPGGAAHGALSGTIGAAAYRAGRRALAEYLGVKSEVPQIATLGTKIAEGDPDRWATGKNVIWAAGATGLDPRFRVTRGTVTQHPTFTHSVVRDKNLITPPGSLDYVVETRITGATVSILAIIANGTEEAAVYVDGYKIFDLPRAAPEEPYPGAQIMYPITFPDDRPRELKIHMTQGGMFQGLLLADGATSSYPAAAPRGARMVIAGDSFTDGAGIETAGTGFVSVLATMLKADIWNSGVGSTGYLATGGPNHEGVQKVKLADRLQNDVINIAPNIVGFAMGRNDLNLKHTDVVTQAILCWDTTRAALPDADIFIIGPFWEHCPVTAQAAQHPDWLNAPAVLLDNLLESAAKERGLFYISPVKERWLNGAGKTTAPANDGGNADYAVSADGVHPTTAGHQIIAWRIAGHLQQAV